MKKMVPPGRRAIEARRVLSNDAAEAIIEESSKGYDLIVVGASQRGGSLGGDVLADVVAGAKCHVAIMRTVDPSATFRRLLVPVDGGIVSRVAVEFAHRYAEVAGAELTIAMLTELRPQAAEYVDEAGAVAPDETKPPPSGELERISRVFVASERKPEIVHLAYDPSHSALFDAVDSGKYDLVVIGAENRAIQNRMFFGYETERLIKNSPIAVVVVVPYLADGKHGPQHPRATTRS
jgi:nucleotide-binding universal stress UspA family protein